MISSFWSNTVTTHTDTLNTNCCVFTKVGNSPQVDVNIHTHASMPAPGEANGFRNRPEIKAMIHCFKPWGIHQGLSNNMKWQLEWEKKGTPWQTTWDFSVQEFQTSSRYHFIELLCLWPPFHWLEHILKAMSPWNRSHSGRLCHLKVRVLRCPKVPFGKTWLAGKSTIL